MQMIDDNIDFEKYLKDHEQQEQAKKVRHAHEFAEAAHNRLAKGVAAVGDPLPWERTKSQFRFRVGELTIWAGVNGNGKSLVMGQVALWLSLHTGVVIASMEMLPEVTLSRMLRQASGQERPTKRFVDGAIDLVDGRLFFYDQVGSVSRDAIIGMIHYAAEHRQVKHVMIDSLVKCGLGTDDYNSQKLFVDKLTQVAKEHNIHIHLVVHIRKGNNETDMPDKFDIKGAGEITDLADNVLIVSRNGGKERNLRDKKELKPEKEKQLLALPDGFIRVAKQRNGEFEGMWGFWWHDKSQQWIPRQNAGAMPWPNPETHLQVAS